MKQREEEIAELQKALSDMQVSIILNLFREACPQTAVSSRISFFRLIYFKKESMCYAYIPKMIV